tara:strand:- start:9170 stop:9745 length:576 start_codon:yes stop_codon:yes gene_type:complete
MVERRIKIKVDKGFQDFKDHLREHFNREMQNAIASINSTGDITDILTSMNKKFIQEIYNYENIHLTEEDFKKRKRIKNTISLEDRCNALRANKMQCSRRKLGDNCYCGTHLKGQPHGVVSETKEPSKSITHIQLWAEEIKGIWYYIDADNNVYDTNDILANNSSPKIIAKYEVCINEKTGENIYSIPDFNI